MALSVRCSSIYIMVRQFSNLPRYEDMKEAFESPKNARNYLLGIGSLQKPCCEVRTCRRYGLAMQCHQLYTYRCPGGCKSYKTCRTGIFGQSHMELNKLLHLAYMFFAKTKRDTVLCLGIISKNPLSNYYHYLQEVMEQDLLNNPMMVGGSGVIVEIDECKLGKRKYNRGHRVEGAWVVGGVERKAYQDANGNECYRTGQAFMQRVTTRDANTLKDVITRHVLPGSIIYTDCWRGYNSLEGLFEHFTVNHSENFVNPETGVHTNLIEGTWNGLRYSVCGRRRTVNNGLVDLALSEWLWRRRFGLDWNRFIGMCGSVVFFPTGNNEP